MTKSPGSAEPATRAPSPPQRNTAEWPAVNDAEFAVSEVAAGPTAQVLSVSVTGRLVGDTAAADLAHVLRNRAAGFCVVLLDLARSPMIDQACLAVIIEAHQRSLQAGGMLSLTAVSPRIGRLLELTGLDRTLLVAHS